MKMTTGDEAVSCAAFTGRQADRRQFGLLKYGTSSIWQVPLPNLIPPEFQELPKGVAECGKCTNTHLFFFRQVQYPPPLPRLPNKVCFP
jgi:hypothetical protein